MLKKKMRKSPPIMYVKTFSKSHNTYVCTNIEGGLKVTYYGAVNRIQFAMLLGARGLRQKSKRIAIWRQPTGQFHSKRNYFLLGKPRQQSLGQAVLAGKAGPHQVEMEKSTAEWLCLLHCRFKQLPFLRWAVLAWDLLLSKNLLSVSVLNFYARHAAFSKDSKRNDVPIKNIDRPIHVHWKFLIGHIQVGTFLMQYAGHF